MNRLCAVLSIAFASAISGCSEEPAPPDRRRTPVIVISVDTLRADRLSCYGYARETSPHIDALAADAVRFTNAVVPRPLTSPSVASMLTGLNPYRHGVPHNFVQLHESLGWRQRATGPPRSSATTCC
jgi:arylsulfatase A-like enzyme